MVLHGAGEQAGGGRVEAIGRAGKAARRRVRRGPSVAGRRRDRPRRRASGEEGRHWDEDLPAVWVPRMSDRRFLDAEVGAAGRGGRPSPEMPRGSGGGMVRLGPSPSVPQAGRPSPRGADPSMAGSLPAAGEDLR